MLNEFSTSLLSVLFYLFINLINRSLRINISNESGETLFAKQNYIFAIWHQKTFTPFYLYRNKKIVMFVTKNMNGSILGQTAVRMGYDPIPLNRDSSKTTVMMCRRIQQGQNAIMAVDGPAGPALNIKNGTRYLSERCRVPTIAVSVTYHKAISLFWRWDRYQIPIPFSRVDIHFSRSYKENNNWKELAHDLGT